MKTYYVNVEYKVTYRAEVKAESEKEALLMAEDMADSSIDPDDFDFEHTDTYISDIDDETIQD